MLKLICLIAALQFEHAPLIPVVKLIGNGVTLHADLGPSPEMGAYIQYDDVPNNSELSSAWVGFGRPALPDRKCTSNELAECRAACESISNIQTPDIPPTVALVSQSCEVSTIRGRLTMTCACVDPNGRTACDTCDPSRPNGRCV